jgi:hypothetical protein
VPDLPFDVLDVPLDGGDLPVACTGDVQAELAGEIADPPVAPLRDAIVGGVTAMLEEYQRRASYAAAQSDPLRATGVYLDEIGSFERGIHKQAGETETSYRARINAFTGVADPEDIIAAANAVLAPYAPNIAAKLSSCVYFEHNDCWFARSGPFYDLVGATNASPIQITARFPLDASIQNGDKVVVSNVLGNTAANGIWPITLIAGPFTQILAFGPPNPAVTLTGPPASAFVLQVYLQTDGPVGVATFSYRVISGFMLGPVLGPFLTAAAVALGTTGLVVHFAAGTYNGNGGEMTYQSVCTSFTLGGSTGTGAYTGGGSFARKVESDAVATLWSSHLYSPLFLTGVSAGVGTTKNGFQAQAMPAPPFDSTPNYPDRLYKALPHRHPFGARTFVDPYGRFFELLVPDISGIDANVSAVYRGQLDIVGATNASPIEIRTRTPLPAALQSGATVTITLVLGNTNANGNWPITVTGPNSFTLGGSTGNALYTSNTVHPDQLAIGAGGSVQFDYSPSPAGGFFVGAPLVPVHTSLYPVTFPAAAPTFLWGVQATSDDVYNTLINAIDAIRGQSVRWALSTQPGIAA